MDARSGAALTFLKCLFLDHAIGHAHQINNDRETQQTSKHHLTDSSVFYDASAAAIRIEKK